MNELSEHSLARAKKFAAQALSGEIHMFLACRKIASETAALQNIPRDITAVFDGVASEIDGLPVGDERLYWEHRALLEQDAEIERYLAEVGPTLRDAMEKLVAFV
jgi:hypothetical protein